MAAICESAPLHRDWAGVAVQPFTLARLGDETMPPLSFTTEELAFIGLAERADRMWDHGRAKPAPGAGSGSAWCITSRARSRGATLCRRSPARTARSYKLSSVV